MNTILSPETHQLQQEVEAEERALELLLNPPQNDLQPANPQVGGLLDQLKGMIDAEASGATREKRIEQAKSILEAKRAQLEQMIKADEESLQRAEELRSEYVKQATKYNKLAQSLLEAQAQLLELENQIKFSSDCARQGYDFVKSAQDISVPQVFYFGEKQFLYSLSKDAFHNQTTYDGNSAVPRPERVNYDLVH